MASRPGPGGSGRLTFVLMHNFFRVGVNTDIPGMNLGFFFNQLIYNGKSKNTGILTSLDACRELMLILLFPFSPQSYPQAGEMPSHARAV
jgi:hypothetical protein